MNLDTYVVIPRELMIRDRAFSIVPLKVRQIPAFTRAIMPALPYLANNELAAAVAERGSDMARAVVIATDAPAEFIDDLHADEFLDLFAAVFEVNADFFVRRVLPRLEQIGRAVPMNGATSSLSSLETVTA